MKLNKKGQMGNIKTKVTGLIVGVILVVVLVTIAPTLWTQLSTSSDALARTTIPFAQMFNSTAGVVGLVFGVVLLLGALVALFGLVGNKR